MFISQYLLAGPVVYGLVSEPAILLLSGLKNQILFKINRLKFWHGCCSNTSTS